MLMCLVMVREGIGGMSATIGAIGVEDMWCWTMPPHPDYCAGVIATTLVLTGQALQALPLVQTLWLRWQVVGPAPLLGLQGLLRALPQRLTCWPGPQQAQQGPQVPQILLVC